MRPASNASLASLRRLASLVTLRYLSSLMFFDPLPERVEVLEAAVGKSGCSAACDLLHGREAPPELRVRRAQRSFGVNAAAPRQIDDGKEHVAKLVGDGSGILALDGDTQLFEFFVELVLDAGEVRPIEAYRARLFLHALRLQQGWQGLGDAVEQRLAMRDGCFLGLDELPGFHLFLRRRNARVAEDVRMAADHLVRQRIEDVGNGELPVFRRDLRVEDDLEQQIAQLLTKFFGIFFIDGFHDFVRFLDEIWQQGGVRLLAIPRTAGTQARHDLD